jgi:hypothetical protein
LEFGGICPGFLCQVDEHFCAFQIAIVIGRDIGYKVGRVCITDRMVSYFDIH